MKNWQKHLYIYPPPKSKDCRAILNDLSVTTQLSIDYCTISTITQQSPSNFCLLNFEDKDLLDTVQSLSGLADAATSPPSHRCISFLPQNRCDLWKNFKYPLKILEWLVIDQISSSDSSIVTKIAQWLHNLEENEAPSRLRSTRNGNVTIAFKHKGYFDAPSRK